MEDETPIVIVSNGCQKQGRGRFGLLLMTIFAVLLTPFLGWGQTSGDYSGIYYIGSVGYDADNPSNNYYRRQRIWRLQGRHRQRQHENHHCTDTGVRQANGYDPSLTSLKIIQFSVLKSECKCIFYIFALSLCNESKDST